MSASSKWHGVPTGFRIRVPLAGMPSLNGIRNSGQQQLPAWADVNAPPHTWKPPEPNFEDSTRQIELARLLATLKVLQEPDAPAPHLLTAAKGAQSQEGTSVVPGWDADQIESLATELS
eukprot:190517-Prymnesium_polylepis.1